MLRLLALAAALFVSVSAAAPDVVLATFDGADAKTTFKWTDMNDPVMGGSSVSTFAITKGAGVFNGTCAIVKFLHAPGFAKIATGSYYKTNTFNDASAAVHGTIDLMVRSSTPTYKGFRLGWAAKNVPRTSAHGGGSFKAGFLLADSADWQAVKIPMKDFSYDWSGFTGRCDTKDPTGQQHHCCGTTGNSSLYCPTTAFLSTITDLEVWAEGVVGDFHIEVKWIGASKAAPAPAPVASAALADASSLKLNNGLSFPKVSFGLQVYDDDTATKLTGVALQAGVRNFFSSVLANNQKGFGVAIKTWLGASAAEKNTRESLFICGSVNTGNGCSGAADCKTQTAAGCASNLQDTALEYLDMIMLDYPAGDCDSIVGQWEAFEDMLKAGKTKSIAVSNFSPQQLDCIVKSGKNMTVPAVNQMPYSVGHGSDTTVADNAGRGDIVVQAYSPLQGGGLVHDADCTKIGAAHGNKTAVQVALRWIIQRNATFTTSASTLAYFSEDLDLFDFTLTPAEMETLDAK